MTMLIDTGVWIPWLNGTASLVLALLDDGEARLAPVVLQELMQGARCPADAKTVRAAFAGQPLLTASDETFIRAGELYARCRWRGITIRGPHDCLIVRIPIEPDTPLLHRDRDFQRLARVAPDLHLWSAPSA